MTDDWRPRFKPDESEPESVADGEGGDSLPDDHPFAALVGHDPQMMRAMGTALRILGEHTSNEHLRSRIADAASGRLAFRDLIQDGAFETEFSKNAERTEQSMTEAREGLSEEEGEALNARGREHAARITENERLVDEVRRAFGHLAE